MLTLREETSRTPLPPSVTSLRGKRAHTVALGTFKRCSSFGALNAQDCGTPRLSATSFVFHPQIIFLPSSRKSLLDVLWQGRAGHVDKKQDRDGGVAWMVELLPSIHRAPS